MCECVYVYVCLIVCVNVWVFVCVREKERECVCACVLECALHHSQIIQTVNVSKTLTFAQKYFEFEFDNLAFASVG